MAKTVGRVRPATQDMPGVPSSTSPPPDYPLLPPGYPDNPADYLGQAVGNYNQPAHPGGVIQHQPMSSNAQPTGGITSTNTTVIINQQPPVVQGPRDWSTGLCDCFIDMPICIGGLLCPCCLPPYVSAMANQDFYVGWFCPIALRTLIRERYNIKGNISDDCCSLYFSYSLTFCQMAREMKIQTGGLYL